MLAKQQLYEVINQLMPQIQSTLSKKIHGQYQSQIQNIHHQYQNQIQQINKLHKNQIKNLKNNVQLVIEQQKFLSQKNKTQIQLRKQLSALQKQRILWLKQQEQYRKLIIKLTTKNNNMTQQEFIHLNPINIQNNSYPLQTSQQSTPKQQSINKNTQTINSYQPMYIQKSSSKFNIFQRYLTQKQEEETQNRQSHSQNNKNLTKQQFKNPSKQQFKNPSKQQFKNPSVRKGRDIKLTHNLTERETNKQNHFTSILSPPKAQEDKSTQKIGKKLFWNNQMKSKLLNLIKISK